MVADLRAGRRTEIDELNGEIVRLGQLTGMPTPVNARLVEMVHTAEADRDRLVLSAKALREALEAD